MSWLPSELLVALPQLGPFTIFTDGSWSPTGTSHFHVTGNSPTFHGAAGIAIISDLPNWKVLPIIVLHVGNGQELGSTSAYSMEVLGIHIGLSVESQLSDTMITICTNCQSAVKKLQINRYRTTALHTKTRDFSLLSASILHRNPNRNVNIKAEAALWTREMWGNHLSDKAAAGVLISPI